MTGEDILGAMYIPPPFKNMLLLVFSEQLPRFLCERELTKLSNSIEIRPQKRNFGHIILISAICFLILYQYVL